MFHGIRWRFTFWLMLIVIVSMAALGAYLTASARSTQMDNLRSELVNEAKILAEAALPYLQDPAASPSPDTLAKKLGATINARTTIIAADGKVLGDSDRDPATMENHADRPEVIDALATGAGETERFSTTLGKKMLYIAVPITDGGRTLGIARLALPLERVEGYVNHLIIVNITALAIITVVVIAAVWLISGMTVKPIKVLTAASRRIASGEYDQKVPVTADDEAGQLARAFNDMAARLKETIAATSGEKTRLSTIVNNLADGIITTDNEGNVTMANRAAEKLLGVKAESMAGRPLIEAARDYELTDVLLKCLAARQPQEVQFEPGGSNRFLRAIAMPVAGEKAGGALVLLQDLTELRALQTTRRELMGNISHDFRTPLAGIKAMAETLREGAMNEPEAARDFLSRIESEVDRLTQMVAELTELSRIETGRTELKKEPVDLNPLIDEVIAQMKPQAERQNITMETTLAAALPTVKADRERIRQVIINLVHNAIKFNKPGGGIEASTGVTGNSVFVEISDTGIGIAARDLPRIFERFYKADRARSGQGAGMGLAIARHIVEAHGGEISARSAEGKGSTFRFRLPLE